MNNKYDIKNFSNVIDTFTVEGEMKILKENVRHNMVSNRYKIKQSIFDPLINLDERQKSAYEFA